MNVKFSIPVSVLSFLLILTTNTYAIGWKWGVGSTAKHKGDIEGSAIVVDKRGNTYEITRGGNVYSSFDTSLYGPYTVVDSAGVSSQGIIVSTDSNGVYRWAIGTEHSIADFKSIAIDSNGYIYILAENFHQQFSIGSHSAPPGMPFRLLK